MQRGESLEGSFQVIKLLSKRPSRWEECVTFARLKFEKYFKRKVMSGIPLIDRMSTCVGARSAVMLFLSVGPTTVALFPPRHEVKRWK